ncbi:hypothetical protein KY339_01765 [Candidatus Woesearchaeota archaeon]|nr:hypothetical protein [Candidatus Woesearchaeota archaeon]
MRKSEKSYAGWWFLLVAVIIYLAALLIKPEILMPSLKFFLSIIKKIIPVFVLVFVLLVLVNYFVNPKKLVKYFGKESGAKGWFVAVIGGIISTGPIYMWYPLLNELQKHKVRNGFIAAFLYNRAVKPALLPLLILYFGLAYTIILSIVMIIISILQGVVVEKIVEVKK